MPPYPPDVHGPPDPAASPSDEPARAAAVVEARAVFDEAWPRWARAHGQPVRPAPPCDAPRVTMVGGDPDDFHYLAVLRFTFAVDGRQFAGMARGPLAAPIFRVWLLADPESGRVGWWRRVLGRDRAPRHRPSTVVP